MRKLKLQISVLALSLFTIHAASQTGYELHLKGADMDSASIVSQTGLQTHFTNRPACSDYINKLPAWLQAKGYVTASLDSIQFDSLHARVVLYLGTVYRWAKLDVSNLEPAILDAGGWREKMFLGKIIDFNQVELFENKILNHLENSGYPFARISLDSIMINKQTELPGPAEYISAKLNLNKGPLYKIDSIRVYGNAKISNSFLQRYLEIPNGSIYNRGKLIAVNKKINELQYIEQEKPFNLSMLGTGSVLNVYLKQKKSSQVNILVGFLPKNNQLSSNGLLITGEGNLLLRNELGGGETFGLNFQALQVESKRLNFLFQYPYIFHSPVGAGFTFDGFLKDSSFVNINIQLNVQYSINNSETGKIFLQKVLTIVSEGGINEAQVIQLRRLPDVADVSSFNLGLDYEYNKTDYRLNPRKGTEVGITTSFGKKKITKNNSVIALKDPSDPGFKFESLYDTLKLKTNQLRVKAFAAKYFPLGRQRSTIKTAINAGTFQSGNIFRNELFQLGGYKLLRGFDEESQYLSSYAIGTIEYHYLFDRNSFFYLLADGGWGQDNRQHQQINYTYFGTGAGLAFETKVGIFNLAWAVGTRNGIPLNLRQSKIHFGFVNYF